MSRLYGGIHFNSGNMVGLAAGRVCGDSISGRLLLPRRGHGNDRDDDEDSGGRDRDDD